MSGFIFFLVVAYIAVIGTTYLISNVIKRRVPHKWRTVLIVFVGTMLCAPSFAPATIVAVPMPYGVVLVIGIFIGALDESIDIAIGFWKWHLISFFSTAAIISIFLHAKLRMRKNAHAAL